MKKILPIVFLVIISLVSIPILAQESYQYLSPKPGSIFNTCETSIIIREGSELDPSCIRDGAVEVIGSNSGKVTGRLLFSSDKRTIMFYPDRPFNSGETVRVSINDGLRTVDGNAIQSTTFSFGTAPFDETPNPYRLIKDLRPRVPSGKNSLRKAMNDSIPEDFPAITVDVNETASLSDGKIFMAVASDVEGIGYYLMVLNNDGTPFWYKKLAHDYAYDFKVQPNGLMTYAQFIEHHSYTGGGNVIHMVMDTSFAVVDSVQMKHGYVAEAHDFQLLPNGHALLFGYYLTQVDMSQYVNGGQPNALVSGGVIQELDADRNVIFQWRTWDYYEYADYSWSSRANRSTVSAFHLNTISIDPQDGHIIVCSPRVNYKINRQTGEFIWKLGGGDNEFNFVGIDSADGVRAVSGHTFYRIDNGNFLVFDNGSRRGTSTSEVHEFRVDEVNKTVEWVWSYIPDETIASWHRGNAQRMPNGNTVIGWGGASGKVIPAMTEVNAAGEKVYEVGFDNPGVESYRAFRFPLPSMNTGIIHTEVELAVGNTYEFITDDGKDTGVTLKVNNATGTGYNEVTVSHIPYAPLYPEFPGDAPSVIPVRVQVGRVGLTTMNAEFSFDVDVFGLDQPENLIIYHRVFPGAGLFIPLNTQYNPVTRMLKATVSNPGEFIFTLPDLEAVALPPLLSTPQGGAELNQTLPIEFTWSPRGFAHTYDLQVANDSLFQNLVVDTTGLNETRFMLNNPQPQTRYFWRVRTLNSAGTSDWSSTQFMTVAPMIKVTAPNGGESWQRGLEYFIRWKDNVDEDIILSLYQNGTLVTIIDTTESNGAFSWEVGLQLLTGNEYAIQIQSVTDGDLLDVSDAAFSIIDTVTSTVNHSERISGYALHQNYPNPFNPLTTISYAIPVTGHVKIQIYNTLGEVVAVLLDENRGAGMHQIQWNADVPSGLYFYRMTVQDGNRSRDCYTEWKRMLLLK